MHCLLYDARTTSQHQNAFALRMFTLGAHCDSTFRIHFAAGDWPRCKAHRQHFSAVELMEISGVLVPFSWWIILSFQVNLKYCWVLHYGKFDWKFDGKFDFWNSLFAISLQYLDLLNDLKLFWSLPHVQEGFRGWKFSATAAKFWVTLSLWN